MSKSDALKNNGWRHCAGAEFRGLWQHPAYPGSRFSLDAAYDQMLKRLKYLAVTP